MYCFITFQLGKDKCLDYLKRERNQIISIIKLKISAPTKAVANRP